MRQFLVVLRGPPGAGKTSLSKSIREAIDPHIAMIDTDIFNWHIVPGEDNKQLVYQNVLSLAENYLQAYYSVIVSGFILTDEENGYIEKLASLASSNGAFFKDFYCEASLELCKERNQQRAPLMTSQ